MLRKIFEPLIRHTREFGCLERRSEGGEGGGGRQGRRSSPYASDEGLFQAQRVRSLRCFGLEKGLDYDQCNLKRGYVSQRNFWSVQYDWTYL